MNNDLEVISTKQKILECAIDLFAMKGYTETSIREIAAAVGVKEASIYNHFQSKNDILEYILDEYTQRIANFFLDQDKVSALKDNPNAVGILSCMRLSFPEDKKEYYIKKLYVILQEQHRNPMVRKYMAEEFILSTEQVLGMILNKLKEIHILRPDADLDFWIKTHSSLIYAFASRMLLGIGDSSQDFSGMGMSELLRNLYAIMLRTCGVNTLK